VKTFDQQLADKQQEYAQLHIENARLIALLEPSNAREKSAGAVIRPWDIGSMPPRKIFAEGNYTHENEAA